MRISDWSSDVCSSDLNPVTRAEQAAALRRAAAAQPFVRSARSVEREELQAMLGQWFGSSEGGDDPVLKSLPLPALVDIDFVGEDRAAPMEALRSEEHTSELQSLMRISYAVFCLKNKKKIYTKNTE